MAERKVAVIGLGYVGLPVAVAFGKRAPTIGFDINPSRIEELARGVDRTGEVTESELKASKVRYTGEIAELKTADFFIVAVPTPVDEAKQPDLTPMHKASELVGKILKKGDIVVYESTVYPGATEEQCVPILERLSGLKFGRDFGVGYSPERINPGDTVHRLETIVKVVAGDRPETLAVVASTYSSVVKAGVHPVSSIRVAEAAKVIENVQRDVNIALMNELAVIFSRMGIDTGEVLQAAGTKWNFLKFTPGLVGGHCIGVDPYYLTHKAIELGYHPEVILSGRKINDSMGAFIANRLVKELARAGFDVSCAKVLVLGVTFKENVPDIRNSKVIDVIRELQSFGIEVSVFDPLASAPEVLEEYGIELLSELPKTRSHQGVVLAVAHQEWVKSGESLVDPVLVKGGVCFDVKGILPVANPGDSGIRILRL